MTSAAAADPPQMTGVTVPKSDVAPFALVELFTSEGCSSCPPADALLARLDAESRAAHTNVYPLSFHVDYWNGLGWSDPFSDAAFSDRQGGYAQALGGGTFTPNMVVNGAESFVGSDEARARRAVATALSIVPSASLSIDASVHGGEVDVRAHSAGAPAGAKLYLALVQASATSSATRGENAGRVLHHVDVVRALTSVAASPDGEARVPLPSALARDGAAVVAWIQDPSTMQVAAATRAPITGL
jgi:hypothetical protein